MHHPQTHYQFAQSPVISSMPSAVSHQHHYASRPAQATTSRVSSTTEFRGSTNPDEDWTKISDLAERRRIQNRIAQRNYRKKLKRRLEDLERRAASRSVSPNGEDTDGRSTRESSTEGPLHSPPPSSEPHLSPPRGPHYSPTYTYSTTSSSYAPTFSSAESTTPYYYPPTTLPGIQNGSHYLYSYSQPTLSSVVEATCSSVVPTTSASYPKSSGAYEGEMSPFYMSYAGLADTPDPNYFNNYYHHEHNTPSTIKQEN